MAPAPGAPYPRRVPPRSLGVLLDLDGTLVDTVPFILASVKHAFAGRTRRPSEAEWSAGIGKPLRVQLAAFAEGPADVEALASRYRAHQGEHHDANTRAFPGAVEAVRALRAEGHRIAIVTGKLVSGARRAVERVGLGALVDAIVGADSCARHKPDPEPVLLALRQLGREPGAAVFVGDAPVDIEAGNAAGVVSVAALWGGGNFAAAVAEARPVHLLARVEDLPGLVARLARAGAAEK